MPTIQDAQAALKKYFGFEAFREGQREVVESVLAGHDTVVVMPTGGGKSLCFQLPALLMPGPTVVISPLIALMKDQVDALKARKIPATFINSSLSFEEQKERLSEVRRGLIKLIYIAPERFRSNMFVDALHSVNVSLFAVDEAHCVSHWGHDFRPDYLRLKQAAATIGRPQMIALTATATPYVRSDISEQLGMKAPHAFISGFDRPNLAINVINTEKESQKIAHIKKLANTYEGSSGIIYTSTRKAVDLVSRKLREAGLSVTAYHAGMSEEERTRAQNDFMSGARQMIVATNAFGMGIDKPDIRFVAHFQMPGSIEAYYQEIGRAGRDGMPSTCSLLFNYADKRTQDYFIEGTFPTPETITRVYQALAGLKQKRIELSAAEIASRAGVKNEMAVNSALVTLERAGHIERGNAAENRAVLRLLLKPADARREVGDKDSRPKQVLFALLNSGINERFDTEVNVGELSESLGIEIGAVKRTLSGLNSAGIIRYSPARRSRGIVMLDEGNVSKLRLNPSEIARRAALEQRKLREVINFCYADRCYRAFILDYFGDRHHAPRCGQCGNCTGKPSLIQPPVQGPANPDLDRFLMSSVPFGRDLEEELKASSARKREMLEAERRGIPAESISVAPPRHLTEEEHLLVRKILSCAARMEGRFGKNMLAGVLRGSRAKNLIQAGLNELTTYGILDDMSQDELMLYIDALVATGALRVSTGSYPTVALTALGGDVMRDKTRIELALPQTALSEISTIQASRRKAATEKGKTSRESYELYKQGLTIEEIAAQRGLAETTIENHLADCIVEGFEFDLNRYVTAAEQKQIEAAIAEHGTERLKPLKDALPHNFSYRMIRFVVAAHLANGAAK